MVCWPPLTAGARILPACAGHIIIAIISWMSRIKYKKTALRREEKHAIMKLEIERTGGSAMRIMAIDYGDARTGLAVSDPYGILCGDAWTVEEWNAERLAETIVSEAAARGVHTLVLGLPKNMDGTEGPRAEKCRAFRELLLEKGAQEVVFRDERRSSIEAHQILHYNGKREKKHRRTVDAVAASLILESYLGSLKQGIS